MEDAYDKVTNSALPAAETRNLPGYDAALRTAAETFSLLGRLNAPPIPKAYEICYGYASGNPKECVERVDSAVERDGLLSLHEVYEIHADIFSYPDKIRQQQYKATDDLDTELNSVLSLVSAHIRSNNAYSNTLDSAADGLKAEQSPNVLKTVIQRLIVENHRARVRARELSESLENSRASINAMRGKLAKAREAGLRDPLTKLFNRRYLDEVLPEAIKRALEEKEPLCLVFVDIDHFKQVNDTFGHPAGDAVLRIFGSLMADNIKGRDIAVRWGGEEFALVLPQTDTAGALSLSNKIRGIFENKRLMLRDSSQSMGTITASFGVAQLRKSETPEQLIARADRMLYEAKRKGRNRVVCDGDEDDP